MEIPGQYTSLTKGVLFSLKYAVKTYIIMYNKMASKLSDTDNL